jgi:hypothetical protein
LHHQEASVKPVDARALLVALSGTRLGLDRELILPGMNIDRPMSRSGTNVDFLAHTGERADGENIEDEASLGCPAAERGILEVVGAAEEEALAVSADDCKYHVATAVPGHKLKVPVSATTSPMFGAAGQ